MPIYAECDVCGKKYRFADDQGGLTVPCKECTADFDVLKPPFFDRRVLVGVGVTVGALVGLFLIAVIVIEIVNSSRGPTAVAVSPSSPVPLPTHAHNSTLPNAPSATPSTVPPLLPRLNSPPTPAPVGATPDPFRQAPIFRAFQPTTVAVNGELKIQGDHLQSVVIIQFLGIRNPRVQGIAGVRTRRDSEISLQASVSFFSPTIDSELCVVATSSLHAYSVTVPRRVAEWQEGQPLPAEYETLVYVRPNSQRRVGAGHHLIFVETGATVDLDGTSGRVFLRPGARIGSMNNIGSLEIIADTFDSPANVAHRMQLGKKVVFCVVEDLVRVTNVSR